MDRWLSGAIVTKVLVLAAAHAGGLPPGAAASLPHEVFGLGAVADNASQHSLDAPGGTSSPAADAANGCGKIRLGETTVATLHNAPIVTLFANGAPVTLLLDTGAETTVLTPAAARRVGAQPPLVEFQRQLHGLAGSLETSEVELRSFSAGAVAIAIPWRRMRVAPVNVPGVFATPLDGVLGADTLSSFDVDLDLPHYRLVFYARQACPNATPAWSEPYASITAGRSKSDHLFFPVQLDGHRIDAFVDTGSQLTVLSARAALALGVSEAVLAHDQPLMTRGAAAEQLSAHLHRFSRLEIAGELVRNPDIIVTDVKLSDADLVLGIDFLRSRRIWFSYGSQKIFLSRP